MLNPKIQAIVERRRNEAVERLQEAFAEDAIDLVDLQRRLDAVESAQSVGAVEVATQDVPPPTVPSEPPASAVAPTMQSVFAVMYRAARTGSFRMPEAMTATALCGNITLDFTRADFDGSAFELHCHAVLMSKIEIIVPHNIKVECTGSGLMGGFDDHSADPEATDAPVLKVSGVAVCGDIMVRNSVPSDELHAPVQEARGRRVPGGCFPW